MNQKGCLSHHKELRTSASSDFPEQGSCIKILMYLGSLNHSFKSVLFVTCLLLGTILVLQSTTWFSRVLSETEL